MAFAHGKNTTVIYGVNDVSVYLNSSTASQSQETSETTTYQATGGSKTYIAGLNDGTISASGLYDGSASAVDSILSTALGSESVLFVAPTGSTIGGRVSFGAVDQTTYEVDSPVADAVTVSAEFQMTAGMSRGVSLHALGAESTSTTSASVDNSASSANGGVAQLHVVANTRNGATTIKVQHSADNSTFADLVTFTSVGISTTTSERIVVASGTTVNRYVRAISTLAGATGSLSYAIAFARR